MSRSLSFPGARVLALASVGAIVAAGSVLGLALPAQAHNYLVSSTPKSGETLTQLPAAFEITTNEALLNLGGDGAGFALQIVDADGLYYGDGCVTVEGSSMTSVPAIGAAGDYTVIWQVVSADGHTVSDELPFTWAPTDDSVATAGVATAPNCGGASGGAAPAAPASASPETAATTANLGDVLWIGGSVVIVGLAIGITLFVVGRRKKA